MDLLELMTSLNLDGRTIQRRSRIPGPRLVKLCRHTAKRISADEVAPLAAALGLKVIDFLIEIDIDDAKALGWQERGYFDTMGEKIRAARESALYSQVALAQKINRTSGWLSQVETNRIPCPVPALVAIANAVDMKPKQLVPVGLKKKYNVMIDNFLDKRPQ